MPSMEPVEEPVRELTFASMGVSMGPLTGRKDAFQPSKPDVKDDGTTHGAIQLTLMFLAPAS